MTGGRRQTAARVPNEGGPAKPAVKGKIFNRAEEEQLCRSVLYVSQDRIVGNQQLAGVFWERISEHYDEHRPDAVRPQRSLETKWGLIKHDVFAFCGVYAQVLRLNKSGTSLAHTLRKSRELYQQKSAKKTRFRLRALLGAPQGPSEVGRWVVRTQGHLHHHSTDAAIVKPPACQQHRCCQELRGTSAFGRGWAGIATNRNLPPGRLKGSQGGIKDCERKRGCPLRPSSCHKDNG